MLTAATESPTTEQRLPAEPPRARLDFLDGLRGLSALYVVFSHVTAELTYRAGVHEIGSLALKLLKLLSFGRYAVDIFIVLSGYCLMLPVARSANGMLRGGAMEYIKRRARRILPPYYAALLLTLLLIVLAPGLRTAGGTYWDICLPAFTPGVLLSHLFLIHNWSVDWVYKISAPMWSVATEWQIYFFFPLLLLPLWRRFGIGAAVLAGFGVGLIPHFLEKSRAGIAYSDLGAPWFLGLFALGMAGAVVSFSQKESVVSYRERTPWPVITAVLGVLLALLLAKSPALWTANPFLRDAFIGLFTSSLIVTCALAAMRPSQSLTFTFVRFLETRPIMLLGAFSYSLYLIHQPILSLVYLPLHNAGLSGSVKLAVMLFFAVPLSIVAAYLFHLAFERRFMSSPSASARPSWTSPVPRSARISDLPKKPSPATDPPVETATPPKPGRIHLDYLDGIRALAALYVTMFHAKTTIWVSDKQPTGFDRRMVSWAMFGHWSVCVFIVLSGFCLMLPVVMGDGTLKGGVKRFFSRRARRILPPYYFAMALTLLLIPLALNQKTGTAWDRAIPVTLHSLLSHLFLVQNLFPRDEGNLNYPFWSVAVEWQIYFTFPLLVLLWKRIGRLAATGIAVFLAYVMVMLLRPTPLIGATPQFYALFALGALGAGLAFSPAPQWKQLREHFPWAWASLGTVVVVYLLRNLKNGRVVDLFVGMATMLLLVALAPPAPNRLRKGLSWRPLVFIGTFSYSIYLLHAPVLQLVWQYGLRYLPLSPGIAFWTLLVVGLSVVSGVSYLFFLFCERPFLNTPRTRAETPTPTRDATAGLAEGTERPR